MIIIENVDTYGFEAAIRGMRNPKNSWEKSDSGWEYIDGFKDYDPVFNYILGPNDLDLAKRLSAAGPDHGKFLRMINVTCDITAPLYWWKEFDTYKVGTVADSCSTMHKIQAKEFELDDFSHEHLISFTNHNKDEHAVPKITLNDGDYSPVGMLMNTIDMLNVCREKYLAALKTELNTGFSAKDIWWQMIQLLPSSYNQRRTVQMNYAVLKNMYFARRNHKLDCWHTFCDWALTLPYFKDICVQEEKEDDHE